MAVVFRAGAARHEARIEKRDDAAVDNFGDPSDDPSSWESIADVWLSIKPLNGRELLIARQISAEVTHEIEMRYIGSFKQSNTRIRLKDSDRVFEPIEPPRNIEERNRVLKFMAKEII